VKDTQAECAEFTETFKVLDPEDKPGNRVVDVFPQHILCHPTPRPGDNSYDNYIKGLDRVLATVCTNPDGIYTVCKEAIPGPGSLYLFISGVARYIASQLYLELQVLSNLLYMRIHSYHIHSSEA